MESRLSLAFPQLKMNCIRQVFLTILTCLLPVSSSAAEISIGELIEPFFSTSNSQEYEPFTGFHGSIGCNINWVGSIERGDAIEIARLYQELYVAPLSVASGLTSTTPLLPVREQNNVTLCLDSSGGSFQEGLAIGRTISERSITTVIQKGSKCYSACAIAFMFGTDNWVIGLNSMGNPKPSRFLHFLGSLGFHAPSLGSTLAMDNPDATDQRIMADENYATAISNFRELTLASQDYSFQADPVFQGELLVSIASTPPLPRGFDYEAPTASICTSGYMTCVENVETAIEWKIEIFGPTQSPKLSHESALTMCNNVAVDGSARSELSVAQTYESVEQLSGQRVNRLLASRFGGGPWSSIFGDDDEVYGHLGGAVGSTPCFVSYSTFLFGSEIETVGPLFFVPPSLPLVELNAFIAAEP